MRTVFYSRGGLVISMIKMLASLISFDWFDGRRSKLERAGEK